MTTQTTQTPSQLLAQAGDLMAQAAQMCAHAARDAYAVGDIRTADQAAQATRSLSAAAGKTGNTGARKQINTATHEARRFVTNHNNYLAS